MKDPRVESLRYALHTDGTVVYREAPGVSAEFPGFRVDLEANRATVTLTDDFPEVSSVRSFVEPYLESWALMEGQGRIGFRYEGSTIRDLSAPETPAHAEDTAPASMSIAHTETAYPAPPTGPLTITDEIESMLYRYRRYREGAETIAGLGNWVLTASKGLAARLTGSGTQDAVSDMLNISRTIVGSLSKLCIAGDARTGRKYGAGNKPHTPAEAQWIEEVVRQVIARAQEYAATSLAPRGQLVISDLPRLDRETLD